LRKAAVTNNLHPSLFTKGGIIAPPFDKGRLGVILLNDFLKNSKGISILFLIIAMMLMVTIGYVLSYLIPTKQKSVLFPTGSVQAFFIAQSGMEYAVRYSADRGWRGTTDSGTYDLTHLNDAGVNQRNLGNEKFTIGYVSGTDKLTSTGEINNRNEKRVVSVSNFTQFLRLIFDPASATPCWSKGTREAHFYIKNARGSDVTLQSFSASWTETGPSRRITQIDMDGTQKYSETYYSGDPPEDFNRGGSSQTITSGQTIQVIIYWNANLSNGANILITFYTGTGGGGVNYIFNLDPEGDGLPNC
jgi:hypothetical protein